MTAEYFWAFQKEIKDAHTISMKMIVISVWIFFLLPTPQGFMKPVTASLRYCYIHRWVNMAMTWVLKVTQWESSPLANCGYRVHNLVLRPNLLQ